MPRRMCRVSLEKLVRSNLHGEIQRTVLLIYDERRAARRAAKNGDFISHYKSLKFSLKDIYSLGAKNMVVSHLFRFLHKEEKPSKKHWETRVLMVQGLKGLEQMAADW